MPNASNSSSSSQINDIIQKINFCYPFVLSVFSTVGNIISFCVFNSHSFKSTAYGFFLKYKSLIDILNVYAGTLRYTFLAANGRNLKDISRFWCYFLNMCVYEVDAVSSWIGVLASLDRLFLVLKPSKYSSLSSNKSRRLQIYSLSITIVLVTVINSSKIIQSYYDENANPMPKCLINNSFASDLIGLLITLAIPFALMILSSYLMAHNLLFSKAKLARNASKKNVTNHNIEKSRSFVKTVLCLDVCFLIFNTPRFVFQLINTFDDTFSAFAILLATILKYSYYSLTIVLYSLSNSLFRKTLKSFFKFQGKNMSYVTDTSHR